MPLPASLADTLELPVVGSPLFIVSGPELVIAQCKAGIVGSFPALNARPVEKLDEWLTRIENELGDLAADRRMAGAQPARGGGKAAGFRHRDEGLAQVPVHRRPVHS